LTKTSLAFQLPSFQNIFNKKVQKKNLAKISFRKKKSIGFLSMGLNSYFPNQTNKPKKEKNS